MKIQGKNALRYDLFDLLSFCFYTTMALLYQTFLSLPHYIYVVNQVLSLIV